MRFAQTLINRRTFCRASITACMTLAARNELVADGEKDQLVTVEGPRPAAQMGITLPHEHVLVDFIGADQVSPDRYHVDDVIQKVEPYLRRAREAGCRSLVECTPAYLGRDPRLLKRLAQATGLQILTNTGYYGAAGGKYLPPHAHTESADQLAERWTAEWRDGIEQTGIRPGFIKIGVDAGPLNEVNCKLVAAAARTHRATGLTIAAHTGDGVAAQQQVQILQTEGVDSRAWIWVHAQNEKDIAIHRDLAQAGAWIEFDGIAPDTVEQHIELVNHLRRSSLLDHVLISQDAGWYWVGEPNGGTFRDYDTLLKKFVPALQAAGFSEDELHQLTVGNPARAFTIHPRTNKENGIE